MAKQACRDKPMPKEPTRCASVTDISTARSFAVERDPDDLRLIAAGWTPKDRCGPKDLTIWANPETGFYFSRETTFHSIGQRQGSEA